MFRVCFHLLQFQQLSNHRKKLLCILHCNCQFLLTLLRQVTPFFKFTQRSFYQRYGSAYIMGNPYKRMNPFPDFILPHPLPSELEEEIT